jgi:hypothetical protein
MDEKNLGQWEKDMLAWIRKDRPTIKTICRHVSSSGMFRLIDMYAVKDGELVYLSGLADTLGVAKRDSKRQGLRVSGCGMDMGFHLVYSFSYAVFPDGFKLRKGDYGRNGDKSGFDEDGGYALKQEWI